jgi:hypothetical protein
LQNEIKGKVYEEMLMVKMNNMPFNSTDYQWRGNHIGIKIEILFEKKLELRLIYM